MKADLLKTLYYNDFKGGLIKAHDEEEWTYSNGILSINDPNRKDSTSYKWDGQNLTCADEAGTKRNSLLSPFFFSILILL